MRVEEMWLIEAEAAARQSYQRGKALIEEFMAYRDENYECPAATQEELVDEVLLQKRIELWGEGQTYFDVKRLNMSGHPADIREQTSRQRPGSTPRAVRHG